MKIDQLEPQLEKVSPNRYYLVVWQYAHSNEWHSSYMMPTKAQAESSLKSSVPKGGIGKVISFEITEDGKYEER